MGKRKFTTYAAKMRQANREALATVAALVIIAVTWLAWGTAAAPASERAAAGVAASAVTESARIEDGEEVRRG